jgi:hypothetical protein
MASPLEADVRFAPEAAGRKYLLGRARLLNLYNATLAIERRGGRDGGGPPMPVRTVDRGQRPWNKGLLIGQKKPLEPKHVWSIRVRLEIARSRRDLATFNLAIDSKLRACDLVKLRLDDVCSGANVRHRATIVQKKTGRPVQFEITEQTRLKPTRPLQTASLATFRGDALTGLLAGLAANSMGSFVKGFTPLRASVAGLCTTDILAKPGMTNSPDSFSSL